MTIRERIHNRFRALMVRITDIVVGLPPVHEASDAEWQLTDTDNEQIEQIAKSRENE